VSLSVSGETPVQLAPTAPIDRFIWGTALACFSLHVALLLLPSSGMVQVTVAMLLLSGLCLVCGRGSGRSGPTRARLLGAGAAAAMVTIHLAAGGPSMAGMDHAAHHSGASEMAAMSGPTSGALSASPVGVLMTLGAALAALQLVLALTALLVPIFRRVQ
jgi:hypothetical protein